MILTVTMNPAVDISYSLEKFELDTVNRVLKINKTPGGKGLKISGETRNCIAILHEGKQTEILEDGPVITLAESEKFLQHFEKLVKTVQIISISGSFPKGIEDDYYSKIIQICKIRNYSVTSNCNLYSYSITFT